MKRTNISERMLKNDTETRAVIRAVGRYQKRYGVKPSIIKPRHTTKRWRWIVSVPD